MTSESFTPPRAQAHGPQAPIGWVDVDLRSLEDQMQRCNHSDHPGLRLTHRLSRLLGFLQQHLVGIVVLLALLTAAFSAAA